MSVAVAVEDLTVKFGDFVAVNGISFQVGSGEIFGFLGANGAGKTTTIRVLCGLLEPNSGEVRVAGLNLSDGPEPIKSKVGYMSQKFTLYDDLTVKENLQFMGSLRKLDPRALERRMDELLEFVGFNRPTNEIVRDLPGGSRQQVSLAAAILHDPPIVFLDEPTAGVTPAARAKFWALIQRLSARGHTVFVTTHYLDEAEQCGRVALMREGKIIALDSPAELKKQAFPEPLWEVEGPAEALAQLAGSGATDTPQPYGLRYHVTVRDPKRWDAFLSRHPSLKVRTLPPSLEDVFIRLVENRQ